MLLTGCASWGWGSDIQLYTNGEKVFYAAGESITIDANCNTQGLWVLTPKQMETIVLDGLK